MNREELEKEIKLCINQKTHLEKIIEHLIEMDEEDNGATDDMRKWLYGITTHLQDLQAQLDNCGERWRAKKGDWYWCVDQDGYVIQRLSTYEEDDEYRYNTLNYHQTREQAEAYRQAKLDVCEKECKIGSYPNIYIKGKAYFTNVQYEFDTIEEADEFAEKLKLILNVKGE